ncbi:MULTISPECIES: ATP-grasp domain-containing protein [Corynebacterium]|uniref:ATP-grasp domain-containing protein n=1 Tax=Corynebacterium TaxID=1716 RepID=UPI00019C2197|nr:MULTISPECIES: ATP-grasp domain-containing protein [Corynebacterium]EEI27161.1 ATP-grasp domain protein [Corynebacterium glucuronolyticum ATCC 51867]MDK7215232.1 ATP-grasp domain-containing protein [Corynebacterium pyruviciproducens]QRO82725.1 ATP-grasp domain-containing protein [Corynebacterium glucuronolyticum]
MDKKRIAILGAGRGQVGLYKAASKLGYDIYAVTMKGTNLPGLQYADNVVESDISDSEATYSALAGIELSGIATSCFDTPLETLAFVAEKKGLVGISVAAAQLSQNKIAMKRVLADHGVMTPQFRVIRTLSELGDVCAELSFPLVIKAPDLQGSNGIFIVKDDEEAQVAFVGAQQASKQESLIVEEFIDGTEFGAQAIVLDNEILFVLCHGDETVRAKTNIPISHFVPANLPEEIQQRATTEVKKAIRALGLKNCAVNVDLILDSQGCHIIELTGRVGANGLPEVVGKWFGIDYYELILRVATGDSPKQYWQERSVHGGGVASRMLFSTRSGYLREFSLGDRPSLVSSTAFVKPGDYVSAFRSSNDCIGEMLVESTSAEDVLSEVEDIVDNMVLRIDEGEQ